VFFNFNILAFFESKKIFFKYHLSIKHNLLVLKPSESNNLLDEECKTSGFEIIVSLSLIIFLFKLQIENIDCF
jgi:hypothetical protein